MRVRTALGLVGIGVLGSLLLAAPASAATTFDVVTDVVVVHATEENFEFGPYVPWEPEGPATFPSVVLTGDDDAAYVLQAYQPVLPAVPAACTLELVSYSVDIELLQDVATSGPQAGFFVGVPAETVDGTTAEFDGVGTTVTNGTYFEVFSVEGELEGTLTLTLPEGIAPDAVPFGWLGFFTTPADPGPLWQVNSVSYRTATTCPDPVLPATGAAPAWTAFAALALLAVGGALAMWRYRGETA